MLPAPQASRCLYDPSAGALPCRKGAGGWVGGGGCGGGGAGDAHGWPRSLTERTTPANLPTRQPAGVQADLLHGHGLTKDKAGNIYFTYASQNPTAPSARALIRFAPDGTSGVVLGNATLALGVPHGIKVQMEADGKEYLYHANNAATVTKTTLDGAIVWRTDMTAAWTGDKTHWPVGAVL